MLKNSSENQDSHKERAKLSDVRTGGWVRRKCDPKESREQKACCASLCPRGPVCNVGSRILEGVRYGAALPLWCAEKGLEHINSF